MTEASLYERLGGAFSIAAVIDHFSDAVVKKVGPQRANPCHSQPPIGFSKVAIHPLLVSS